jgi:hypothetical protein
VSELNAHSSTHAQEADLGTGPDAAVSEENQQVDFAADRQRTSCFDVAATQAHIAKNTIVNCRPVVSMLGVQRTRRKNLTRVLSRLAAALIQQQTILQHMVVESPAEIVVIFEDYEEDELERMYALTQCGVKSDNSEIP